MSKAVADMSNQLAKIQNHSKLVMNKDNEENSREIKSSMAKTEEMHNCQLDYLVYSTSFLLE